MSTARMWLLPLLGGVAMCLGQTTASAGRNPSPPARLPNITRICVEGLGGAPESALLAQEVAIASLFEAKRFVVTENCQSADALVKGAVMERATQRSRREAEGADIGVAAGGVDATGGSSGTARFGSSEALASTENGSHVTISIRVVNRDGDVLWAGSQDSPGGKTKAAVPDATERVIKRFLKILERDPRESPVK